jgi:hypothetical protein
VSQEKAVLGIATVNTGAAPHGAWLDANVIRTALYLWINTELLPTRASVLHGVSGRYPMRWYWGTTSRRLAQQ